LNELEPVAWLLVFIVSITAHEAAHAWAAYVGGDPTAYQGGQVSLNPLPHMRREPFGMVVIPLLTTFTNGFPIGWASTPYDPRWEERYPRRAAWMAAAGPAANLALAFASLVALRVGLELGTFTSPAQVDATHLVMAATDGADGFGRFLSMMLVLNTILCLFNLIPMPPLDGASAITLLLPEQTGLRLRQALRQPALAMAGLFAVWFGFGAIVRPVFGILVRLVHPEFG
jgi:Zn-dependent protease